MFTVNTSRTVCRSEMNFSSQPRFFSCFVRSNFNWWKAKNDFRRNVDFYAKKLHPRFEAFKTSNNVKEHSAQILKTWSQQLEFIIAHRIRRGFQMIVLYRKWLPDEFQNTKFLSNKVSPKKDPSIPEDAVAKENDCNCDRCSHLNEDGWSLFYQGRNIYIWRKEHNNYKDQGLYVYKVWGSFKDVTAYDFFQVQIDTEYRKEWDPNSIELRVIDSDPQSNSDILYWEFLFPTMFYNRDYVCNRRFEIDEEKKIMAIISQSVEHPMCPRRPPIHRVSEYWSHIVIKPTKGDFDEPGMEFTITYFDNPELIIPSYISVWYTVSGLPDYIMRQRHAAKLLARRRFDAENVEKESPRPALNREPNNESQGRRVMLM